MPPEIQTAQDTWPQLSSIVFVPRTKSDYRRLSALRGDLGPLIDKRENHPLESLADAINGSLGNSNFS